MFSHKTMINHEARKRLTMMTKRKPSNKLADKDLLPHMVKNRP